MGKPAVLITVRGGVAYVEAGDGVNTIEHKLNRGQF